MAAILRKAFQATMSDPEFLAEAQKVSMDIDPVDGMEIQTMLAAAYASPAPVVARASSLLGR
jgi:hypothetical protein